MAWNFKEGDRVQYVYKDADEWPVNTGTVVSYRDMYTAIVRWDDGSEGPCPEMKLDPLKESKPSSRK